MPFFDEQTAQRLRFLHFSIKNKIEEAEAAGINWVDSQPTKYNANNEITQLILEWFDENPDPDDDDVHALAEDLDMEPDDLEEIIYELATEHAAEDNGLSTDESDEDVLTVEIAQAIGDEIGINWEEAAFDPEQLLAGIKVELEHGKKDPETNVTDDDLLATAKIAWAHLKEMADYYVKLKELEDSANAEVDTDNAESVSGVGEVESEKGTNSFNEGFPGKVGRAYITMCPECKAINSADYWEQSKCDTCHRDSIPGYFWTHTEEEMKSGGPKESIPDHLQAKFNEVTGIDVPRPDETEQEFQIRMSKK